METSQTVIERTLYASLLRVALNAGVTVNPEDYLPVNAENQQRYHQACSSIETFVAIFGVGNSQVRGQKILPRITIDLTSYYPGDLGVEPYMIGDKGENEKFILYGYPFETKNSSYDIHLVAQNANQMRLLHQILYTALPGKGYIRPFVFETMAEYLQNPGLLKSGNLFVQVGNFYDHNDVDHGILEKVYTYDCIDGLIDETIKDANIAPIHDISAIINKEFNISVGFSSLIQSTYEITNSEFSKVIIDSEDILVWGLRRDGTEYSIDLTGQTFTLYGKEYDAQYVVDYLKGISGNLKEIPVNL